MVSVHHVPVLALLALLPVAAYTLSVETIAAVALLNVGLITASVYAMFLPSEAAVTPAA